MKLSQYADDTTLILDGSKDTLETSLDVIDKFSKISDLRLNNNKTEALWIGSKAGSSELLCPEKDFEWQEFKIKTLGVWPSIEPELTMILNFEEKNRKSSERTSKLAVSKIKFTWKNHYIKKPSHLPVG